MLSFVDKSGQTVLSVTPSTAAKWDGSGQSVQLVDFSELKTPGTYTIKVNGQEVRKDLKIADKVYGDVSKALLKWFYYQRASMALEEQYAGKWKRSAGHPDKGVAFHSSATGAVALSIAPRGVRCRRLRQVHRKFGHFHLHALEPLRTFPSLF
jgi:Glycosyl hydrolase family 9./N-terminal ig-like domain of cellulase.